MRLLLKDKEKIQGNPIPKGGHSTWVPNGKVISIQGIHEYEISTTYIIPLLVVV